MAVYTLRIEATTTLVRLTLLSAATWARAPGHALRFDAPSSPSRLAIDDRLVELEQSGTAGEPLTLLVQVATADSSLTLQADTVGAGRLVVTSASDARTSDSTGSDATSTQLVLLLRSIPPPSGAGDDTASHS